MNIFKELKWKLFMWKTNLHLTRLDTIDKYMRKHHCRYGYHKIKSDYIGFGEMGKRMTHIRFLKCQHCNYLFFAKKADKERYEKHTEENKTRLKTAVSALLKHSSSVKSKHFNDVGECDSRGASVSVEK